MEDFNHPPFTRDALLSHLIHLNSRPLISACSHIPFYSRWILLKKKSTVGPLEEKILIHPNKVQLLPPQVAERIAAGEVIERPASVVKELVENALDAQATEISVVLEDGGKSLIEVTDNGLGMSAEDLQLCIERHATSKLSTLEDLDRISTLGFRGEALPSVAAVSELSILSREKGATQAYELIAGDVTVRIQSRPTPQKITFGHFNSCSHGTRIQARGLFSQIPARLKFLKSQGAEVSQVREWMERLSLAYPHVGFLLKSGEREVLSLRPQSEQDRVREILSDGEDYPLVLGENEQDGFRDQGFRAKIYWLQGLSSPQNKKLIQVVNHRALRDRMLQQALLGPFRQALLPGQFPALALFIEVNPAAIDVNVHPTKSEIRFLDGRKVFSTLESVVREMIEKQGAPAIAPFSSSASSWMSPAHSNTWNSTPDESPERVQIQSSSLDWNQTTSPATWHPPRSDTAWSGFHSHLSSQGNSAGAISTPAPPHSMVESPFSEQTFTPMELNLTLNTSLPPFLRSARPVGILFRTYLVYEDANELVLIDQHAAHERIRYEQLKNRFTHRIQNQGSLESQSLLIPEAAKFPSDDRALIESRLSLLLQFGFDAEVFGEDTLLFRAIPAGWGAHHLAIRLKSLVHRILELDLPQDALLWDENVFEALASEACHSAIRAGDSLEPMEASALIQSLFACKHPWNCPHGRPTVVKVHEKKLEEWFQRKL